MSLSVVLSSSLPTKALVSTFLMAPSSKIVCLLYVKLDFADTHPKIFRARLGQCLHYRSLDFSLVLVTNGTLYSLQQASPYIPQHRSFLTIVQLNWTITITWACSALLSGLELSRAFNIDYVKVWDSPCLPDKGPIRAVRPEAMSFLPISRTSLLGRIYT